MTLENEFNPFESNSQALAWVDTVATVGAVGGTRHGPAGQVHGAVIGNYDIRGGELFIAMPGLHVHGVKFIPDATPRGAKAMLTDVTELDLVTNPEVPVIIVPDIPHAVGHAAAMIWDNPANHLQLWGATGTNGRVAITYLPWHFLRRVEKLVALVETVEVVIGKRSASPNITTPQAI